jgi:dTDP-4-amino-4,6-dideoxygalactose transaminase
LKQAGALRDDQRPIVRQIGVGGVDISARARELVSEVLGSGRLTAGPMMSRFEQSIASAHDCAYGLMCNSGTSALQIALAALRERHGWSDGDEVLVPAVTFVASSNVVMYNGLKPVFVDVEPDHYEIDPALIEAKIGPRTRAIMPVHLAGHPCNMAPIMEIARERGLRVVEDSCETMFARDHGRAVGSFGDVGCFSTYVAHVINTGVGGLCTTNDPELIVMLKSLMNHGRDSIYIRMDDDRGSEGDELFQIIDRRFSFVRLGHSFRCTELEAALGVAEFERWEENVARRRAFAAKLTAGLSDLQEDLQLPAVREGADHVFMFYPLVVRNPRVRRDDLVRHLESRGVETRYLLPLINQPVYRDLFGDLDAEYPVAAHLNSNAFYVGSHPQLADEDADIMIETFHEFFRSQA